MTKNKQHAVPVRIFLIAGEASGDALAAELIAPLQERFGGDTEFAGIGGPAMTACGIASPIAMSQLSVLGYFEGLLAWRRISRLAKQTARLACEFDADIVVLIDSWGFTLRVARGIRVLRPEAVLVKYVGPQVWASRSGRAQTLSRAVDHLLTIHSFDMPYYADTGLAVTFVGNPVLSRKVKGDGAAVRKNFGIAPDTKILLVLFGSRQSEFSRLHHPFVQAVQRLRQRHPDLVVLCPLAPSIATHVRAAAADDPCLHDMIFLDEDQKADAFATADLALACSGTVTTELAAAGVPMVVGYRLGVLSWLLLKVFFLRTRFVSLVNLASAKMIVPEFLQGRCQADLLYPALEELVQDKNAREAQKKSLATAVKTMGLNGPSTTQRVAEAICSLWQVRR